MVKVLGGLSDPDGKHAGSMNEDEQSIALALSPAGKVHLDPRPPPESVVPSPIARLLARADGDPAGALLDLAARHPGESLPPGVAFFRDLAALFLTRVRSQLDAPAPAEELVRRVAAAPPFAGAEYLNLQVLESLWAALRLSLQHELRDVALEAWFHERNPAWNVVGRVCFHLAENKADPAKPFAFLATYTTRLSEKARPQHRPLGQALQDFAGDKHALLALLLPVQRAAAQSALVKELEKSGHIYRTLAWSAAAAHRFLLEVPALEAAGVLVRIPDWWQRRPRASVQVTVGSKEPGGVGLVALVDFDVRLAVDGEPLSAAEYRALSAQQAGLALVRGKWVELDHEKLDAVLAHWKTAQRHARAGELSLLEAMRLVAGAGAGTDGADAPEVLDAEIASWSRVSAGPWLKDALEGLRKPEVLEKALPGAELKAELRPYQEVGVRWLGFTAGLGLGACLADDMGLGKTIQVLGFLLARKKAGLARGPALLVAPASLLGNWTAELERFAPSLRVQVAHASAGGGEVEPRKCDLVIITYAGLTRGKWASDFDWDAVILDEAQAVKNPGAGQTRAVKSLKSRVRIALTGTPVENRPLDLWSIFDFLNPGLLGSAKAFGRFVKALEKSGYAPLRELTKPYILRRLKTDKSVIRDLPDKTEVTAHCGLSRQQAALYQETIADLKERLAEVSGIERRGLVLASLVRLKQICNHPSHWLRDGTFAPAASGKFVRLTAICEEIASRQERALVFTQFREMTAPLAEHLRSVFGAEGLVLHGGTAVGARKELVDRFQRGEAPFFVLSTKAGGVGLNLTAAAHVIHFDRWWNPAVEDQATDRAFRIGQKQSVLVHKFVCRGTVEERIDGMLARKKRVAGELLEGGADAALTEMGDAELLRTLALDLDSALAED
jgi:SNF2-related domain/SNF2 Helicase protein/Helicase conserved C-terminal domain